VKIVQPVHLHITGFGSFRNVEENPTKLLVDRIEKEGICTSDTYKILSHQVLTVKTETVDAYFDSIGECPKNTVFIHFGVYSQSPTFNFETQAINGTSIFL
jgi:pyrrolidone-carboxylate peptidase